ncbi:MAG TPA: Ig-like domain-containing protein, partial [Chitinophagaceae bacterium]|nr:Ig-like domain-containing protein [Chitinophagaceae bacterium]
TCSSCPPVAVDDSSLGGNGATQIIDVLVNDYDPNNNIDSNSLTVLTQPGHGSAVVNNKKIVYIPNGSFAGYDTIRYKICDLSTPTALCDTAYAIAHVNPAVIDPCSDAVQNKVYYLPYPEDKAAVALDSMSSVANTYNTIRTVISLSMPYPGMIIRWDHWEDGFETDINNPAQSTTLVWGDGNPYNGIAPGYPTDIIPAGAGIVLDNTMSIPRSTSTIMYDGGDKITSPGQLAVTQVCGLPSVIGLQCMKNNVVPTSDYGTSFTIPVGQNFNSRDFRYTSLFIRAAQNNTIVTVDKDNNGTFETSDTIAAGETMFINGSVLSGATVSSNKPVGVDMCSGGNDNYSSRQFAIFPASWYSNVYYSPVPTTHSDASNQDTAAVYLYNSFATSMTINWSSGAPASGSITVPSKSVVRFPMALSSTACYKFQSANGDPFTALQVCDSYTDNAGNGNSGSTFDWSFNLIAENRLTDFATIAWAPGSTDGTQNDGPIWVTPTANTTIYVKYDGDVANGSNTSPCGLKYDVSYAVNALNYKRLLDASDNDQSGIALWTCDGTKFAAVYGEDASTAS